MKTYSGIRPPSSAAVDNPCALLAVAAKIVDLGPVLEEARMDLHLANKTALVTGGSRGIGLEITRTLLDEGVRVVTSARSSTPELEQLGVPLLCVDLACPESPTALVEFAVAELGGLDILVNNVGGSDAFVEFAEITDDAWQEAFELNFFSAVRTVRASLPTLLERRGVILNVSSTAARLSGGPMDYAAAKAALTNFGKNLAEQLGPKGVRVATVTPGTTRTRVWTGPDGVGAQLSALAGMDQETFVQALPESMGITIGRLVQPSEIASLVAWLASPRAAACLGVDYVVDGGGGKAVWS